MLKNKHSSNFKARIRAEKIGSSVVIANFGSWELTLREAIFSLLIVGSMVGVGFLIAGKIEQSVLERIQNGVFKRLEDMPRFTSDYIEYF